MSPDQPPAPPRRADAERNRDKILTAARAAFAESGAQVSMAEISRRAGVGMATLYRNFPGRRELLEALYLGEVDAVCAAAATAAGETPGAALASWLYRFYDFFTGKHDIAAELLAQSGSDNPVFNESRPRVLAAARPLLTAAQQAHEVRDDLTLEQITDMIIAIASIHGDRDYVEPILRAAFDGLRPAAQAEP
ncbi:TetR/AcrR family transcriptional regulator [Spongiactinospora rosea]|uniref:TetR/AcrR family transcriptional regulator n=1 Tax=Spongiactinospora rosea TaxID=2248750 RepID=A0A366LSV9_9ACTN|nr:TetR/AcrR family transcriptional regulator [Spongiactinospora rosea]